MDFGQRLRDLRIINGYTQQNLGEKTNVSVQTVQSWESGRKSPSMSAIISLSKALDVSSDKLLGLALNDFHGIKMTPDARLLLSEYSALDKHGKRLVKTVCRLEYNRIQENNRSDNVVEISRWIPLYEMPAAAGASAPFDNDAFEPLPVSNETPSGADFAVRIQGDSMSPYINDGDTVFVKRSTELSIGDIGIFCVDGAMYCKQYFIDEKRNLHLLSANPALKSTNVTVRVDGTSSVTCYGKVLLAEGVPLPNYLEIE